MSRPAHHPLSPSEPSSMTAAAFLEKEPVSKRLAFVFPFASGHLNPSLPIARSLVRQGHQVHYLCREQLRHAIECTGASFYSDVEVERELFDGRSPDMFGALNSLICEFGLESDNRMVAGLKLSPIQVELKLPGVVRWLRDLDAGVVMYDPLLSPEAAYAAEVVGVPSVALLTTAGPGSLEGASLLIESTFGATIEAVRDAVHAYKPQVEAVQRLWDDFGISFESNLEFPIGKLGILRHSSVTLVTTSEELQISASVELLEAYRRDGVRFVAVGPLLDESGATRAAGHCEELTDGDDIANHSEGAAVVSQVLAAKSAGRPVVLVSMGTIITGDDALLGWEARIAGSGGQRRGLTGRELCQSAWAGAFDAFGSATADEGPLLLVAVGPQERPLGSLTPPANAVCLPVLPQLDILRAGVNLFLTHGGQNSTMEALSCGVPLVVCPGFGDQVVNAHNVEALGLGLQIPRPDPEDGTEATVSARYRADVGQALKRVFSEKSFRSAAAGCAERLRGESGVPGAVELMMAVAAESGDRLGSKGAKKRRLARLP